MPKRDALQLPNHEACETLTGITLEHLPRDRSVGQARRYRKGAYLWRAEDKPDRLHFLEHGQAAVMTSDRDGREIILRVVDAGQPLGELCFCSLQSGRRLTVARAVVDCTAVEVKYTDFADFLRTNREAFDAFVVTFCVRLGDAERRIEVLAHRGATDRLGGLLLQLAGAGRGRGAEQPDEVALYASHEELAQMAALSRAHVTVTMGRLRRLGLVHYDRNRPLVVHVRRLAKFLADEDTISEEPSRGASNRSRTK